MNKVFYTDGLTRDVDVKFSRDTAFALVSIAIDRRFSKEKTTGQALKSLSKTHT